MKQILTAKSLLHVDETYAQIINRSDGKSGQSNAYNWVFRSVPCQGPTIVLFIALYREVGLYSLRLLQTLKE